MRADGTFTVESFEPTSITPSSGIDTNLPVSVSTMEKHFDGEVVGRAATLFTAAFHQESGVGTYVAMESFEGTVNGRRGTFNFTHAASTSGTNRADEYFLIVPESGTEELSGIVGSGGMKVDPDGTHRIWFEYEIR